MGRIIFLTIACFFQFFPCFAEVSQPLRTTDIAMTSCVVAHVNEEIITREEVLQAAEDRQIEYDKALDILINQKLLMQDFNKKKGHIPAAQLDIQMDDIIQTNFSGNRAAMQQVLRYQGQSFYGLKQEIQNSIIINVMREQQMISRYTLSPKQIRDYYNTHKEEFKIEARYFIQQSGFKSDATCEINGEKLLKVDVLKNPSQMDSVKDFNSFVGEPTWYNASELNVDLLEVLKALKKGQTSSYMRFGDVYLVTKYIDKTEAVYKPLAEVQSDIETTLLADVNAKRYQDYIDQLKKKSVVVIDKEVLQQLGKK